MKRILALVLFSLFTLGFVAAQSGQFLGLGHSSSFRVGPGKDDTGTQVYSFNYVYGSVIFNAKGKIVDLEMDILEVATPNYDGVSMPHFTGWPGDAGYKSINHATGKVEDAVPTTVDSVTAEVNGWKSKRDRGDTYGMNKTNDWWKQMDSYEKIFIGKSVGEIDAWFDKYTTDSAFRPLNPATKDAAEKAKFDKLSRADQKIVVDVRAGATMSVHDAHGDVIAAIKDAWNHKKAIKR